MFCFALSQGGKPSGRFHPNYVQKAVARSLPLRECAQIAWRPKGRYGIHLHADGVGIAHRHACLCTNRCHSFDCGTYAGNGSDC